MRASFDIDFLRVYVGSNYCFSLLTKMKNFLLNLLGLSGDSMAVSNDFYAFLYFKHVLFSDCKFVTSQANYSYLEVSSENPQFSGADSMTLDFYQW